MTLSKLHESSPVTASMPSRSRIPLLVGAALLAAAFVASPAVADATPRDGHRDVVIVTSSGHHRQGHRHRSRYGRAPDRYHHGRGESLQIERARRYAGQATAQASTAWRLGCARSGPRWSTDWNDHYYWALDARPRHLRQELDRREHRLRECRVWSRHSNRHSRHYRHR